MYQFNGRDLPRLDTYQDALKHYESVKPIRGRDVKPLGDRRYTHRSIHKLFDGSIACRLHNTDCVIYHTDGSLTIDFGSWYTQTTAAFISAVSPYGICACASGYVAIRHQGYFMAPGGGLKICPEGKPMNPVQEYRKLVDKKKAVEIRKKLKPFRTWVKICQKLGGEFPHGSPRLDIHELLRNPENAEIYPSVVSKYFFQRWDGIWREHSYSLLGWAYEAAECFIYVPVPLGDIKKKTQWERY